MKTLAFSNRTTKEILRDKINLIFGIALPIVMLLLLTLIQSNIPIKQFPIEQLAPGIAVFSLSFIALFSGVLIAKDRTGSFMMRLMSSPLKPRNFILGYISPLIPMALAQTTICFIVALWLGLPWSLNIILAILANIPVALIFISIGLISGTLFSDKQVSGLCGGLLTNISAWLSGIWFDVALVGGWYETIANILPFVHAVNVGKLIMAQDYVRILPELIWVIGYAIVLLSISILVFTHKMKKL